MRISSVSVALIVSIACVQAFVQPVLTPHKALHAAVRSSLDPWGTPDAEAEAVHAIAALSDDDTHQQLPKLSHAVEWLVADRMHERVMQRHGRQFGRSVDVTAVSDLVNCFTEAFNIPAPGQQHKEAADQHDWHYYAVRAFNAVASSPAAEMLACALQQPLLAVNPDLQPWVFTMPDTSSSCDEHAKIDVQAFATAVHWVNSRTELPKLHKLQRSMRGLLRLVEEPRSGRDHTHMAKWTGVELLQYAASTAHYIAALEAAATTAGTDDDDIRGLAALQQALPPSYMRIHCKGKATLTSSGLLNLKIGEIAPYPLPLDDAVYARAARKLQALQWLGERLSDSDQNIVKANHLQATLYVPVHADTELLSHTDALHWQQRHVVDFTIEELRP
eukprot:4271-Heterococcus_DN1.PRE.2